MYVLVTDGNAATGSMHSIGQLCFMDIHKNSIDDNNKIDSAAVRPRKRFWRLRTKRRRRRLS